MSRIRLALYSSLLAIFLLLELRPLDDFDICLQIKLGQLMLQDFHPARSEPFSYLLQGQASPALGWLSQAIYALLYSVAGWPALRILRAFCFAAACAIALSCDLNRRSTRGFLPTDLHALLLASAIALKYWELRAAMFAALLFCLTYAIACRPDGRHLIARLLPLGILWQNAHPSLNLGALLLLVLAADRRAGRTKQLLGAAALFGALQFATPDGLGILALSAQNYRISKLTLGIDEWAPAWHPALIEECAIFWLAMLVSLYCLARLAPRREIHTVELLLFLTFGAPAASASRFILYFALSMLPVWKEWFARLAGNTEGPAVYRALTIRERGLAVCSIFPFLAAAWVGPGYFLNALPLDGVAYLNRHLSEGNVYATREWSGPLVLYGKHDWKLAYDGRLYLYSRAQWLDYQRESSGKSGLAELLERHKPAAFFLHPVFQGELAEQLGSNEAWRETYRDEKAVIFLPRHVVSAELASPPVQD